jgi:hypothetical protein
MKMKNQMKIRTWIIIIAVYLYIILVASSFGIGVLMFLILYVAVAIVVANALLTDDLESVERDSQRFRKVKPLRGLGSSLVDFQHVFYSKQDVLAEIMDEINARMERLNLLPMLQKREFTDVDKDLDASESREFYVASSEPNRRGTEVALALHFRKRAEAQSVQWWVLMRGFVDRNKKLFLMAIAPIALPFWIISRLKQELDLASSSRTVYDAFYNSLDVVTDARSLHTLVFDTLVDILEKHDIDVSDLKLQRAQVMNVSISGGRARFGNIVQSMKRANVVQTGGQK